MSDSEKYLIVELFTTFLLLASPVLLLASVAGNAFLFILGLIGLGFMVSWLLREKFPWYAGTLVAIGMCAVLMWMVKAILDSTFLYKEVVLICIQGLLFLEIVLSFSAGSSTTLGYPQILSIPLFLCYPTLGVGYDTPILVTMGVYFLCWLLILKIKFYAFFKKPFSAIHLKQNAVLIGITAALIFFVSAMLYFKFPFKSLKVEGIFSDVDGKGTIGVDTATDAYYTLQDAILKKAMKLIPHLRFSEDRYSLLNLLDYLVKESSTIMEVEKAEAGLISYLKVPGPGLEEAEIEEAIVMLRKYVAQKIQRGIANQEKEIRDVMRREPFNLLGGAASISALAHKMSASETAEEIRTQEQELRKRIEHSSFTSVTKEGLVRKAEDLKEWKHFDLYHKKASELSEKNASFRPEEALQTFSEFSKADQESASLHEEITAQITQEQRGPVVFEGAEDKPKEKKEAFLRKEDGNAAQLIPRLLYLGIGVILVGVLCTICVLYFLTLQRRKQLMYFFDHPRAFIPHLYAHVRTVISFFGPGFSIHLAPLAFAAFIEHCYAIEDRTFSVFSAKFSEAQYSSHSLKEDDSIEALKQYNDFLKTITQKTPPLMLFWVYVISLLKRQPLFIPLKLFACQTALK